MYSIKELYEAQTVDDAVNLLQIHPDAGIIAGGSDVLIKIREGKLADKKWVSIYGIDELRGVSFDGKFLRIGSLTSFSHITRNPLIKEHIPVLGEAVDQVGGPQIRNIGTIGGNTCNGVTSADSASTLFAYDAIIELTGKDGKRRLPISEFYLGAGKVDLRRGEIQTAILIEENSLKDYYGYYVKYAMRNAMDIATLGVSANVKLSKDKSKLDDLRIGFGVAGPIPLRAGTAETRGRGREISYDLIKEVANSVLHDIKPRDSWRASKDFREHMAITMTQRALFESIQRAGGKLDAI